MSFDLVEPNVPVDDGFAWALIRRVWDQYGKYGGIYLSELTHRAGTPWEEVWSGSGGVKNAAIENERIKKHYESLRERNVAKKAGAEVPA